jgi:cytochrome oxidase assembly protein ShyY1
MSGDELIDLADGRAARIDHRGWIAFDPAGEDAPEEGEEPEEMTLAQVIALAPSKREKAVAKTNERLEQARIGAEDLQPDDMADDPVEYHEVVGQKMDVNYLVRKLEGELLSVRLSGGTGS